LVFYKNKYYYKKYFSYGISISYRWVKFYHNNLKFAIGNYGDVYGNIDYLNLFSKSKLNIGSGCFWIKTHWKQISFRNVILFSFGNIEDFTKNKIYDFYNIYLKSDFRYFFFKKIINLGFSFKFVSNFLNKKSAFNNVKFLEKYSNNFFSDTKNYDLYFFFQKIKYNLNIIKIDSYIKLIIFKHVKIFANIYFSFSDKLKENFLNKFHSTYFGIRISMLVANRNSLFLRLNYNYLILLKNILKNNKKKNNNIYKGSVEMGIRY
jgi:hypothetical protein